MSTHRATLALLISLSALPAPLLAEQAACDRIEVFVREGCPHCAEAKRFLAELAETRPDLVIREHDLGREPGERKRLHALSQAHGVARIGVPTFLVCDRLLVGFSPGVSEARLLDLIGGDGAEAWLLELPWIGRLDLDGVGLPLLTLALGLVDGVNPCAMWVLLFLLSLLVHVHSRRRMFLVAGTFVLVSGVAYFAFMAAWLNVFLWIGFSRPLQLVLGVLAVGIGSLHVKEYFALGRGPSLSIPERSKPGLYARMRRIVRAENLPAALLGAFVLAVLVNAVELLCTAGIPAVYTQFLASQELSTAGHYAYLALYNVAYMFDDGLVVAIAVVTLGSRKLQEKQGRRLQLVSGVVILVLGTLLILAPGLLGP